MGLIIAHFQLSLVIVWRFVPFANRKLGGGGGERGGGVTGTLIRISTFELSFYFTLTNDN